MRTHTAPFLTIFAAMFCFTLFSAAHTTAGLAENSTKNREKTIFVSIGKHRFTIDLADTVSAEELSQLLPLTLVMQDHLRNEKHADLPRRLSTGNSRPGRIEAGDVMLWQGKTLVVFYESFDSAYSYTRLGKIRDVRHLKAAVGRESVRMDFTAD